MQSCARWFPALCLRRALLHAKTAEKTCMSPFSNFVWKGFKESCSHRCGLLFIVTAMGGRSALEKLGARRRGGVLVQHGSAGAEGGLLGNMGGHTSASSCSPCGVLEERVLPQGGARGLTLLLVLQQCEPPWSIFHFLWMSEVSL